MPEGQVLEFNRVTKRFGAITAVSDLSVRVEPGLVTGFLGPNGAGKTTSLRILLGQIRPTSGTATIGGQSYSELRNPLRTVGAVLEESAYRPRRTATRQLLIAAKANGIPSARVDEVLRLVGLQDDADTRLGSYSLGMRQRLAVASALLGDPGVLVLDEPANGLDPEGIRWMRLLIRRMADEGRTVVLSSHVLSEIEQVADNVVVLSKGQAVYSGSIDELAKPTGGAVIVDAANRAPLITALSAAQVDFDVLRSGVTVRGSDAATVGAIAAAAAVPLTVLQQRGPSLEEVFLDLVYGRHGANPSLNDAANPVAHAPAFVDATAADTALVAGGVPLAGAAAAIADGGAVAAAGVGYGTAPIDIIPRPDAEDAAASLFGEAESADGAEAGDATDADVDAEHAGDAAETENAAEADAESAEASGTETEAGEDTEAVPSDGEHAPVVDEGADGTVDAADGADEPASDEKPDHAVPAGADVAAEAEEADAQREPADESPAETEPAEADAEQHDDGADQAADADDADATTDDDDAAAQRAATEASVAALWAPRVAAPVEIPAPAAAPEVESSDEVDEPAETASEPDEPDEASEASESDETDETDETDEAASETDDAAPDDAPDQGDAEAAHDGDAQADEHPTVLPLATASVSIPVSADLPSFTELITGLPASVAEGIGEPTSSTEAISIFAPVFEHDDADEDASVDDDADDPRLAAMRTSLSSAASRFFDGPAPDYPYHRKPQDTSQDDDHAADDGGEGTSGSA